MNIKNLTDRKLKELYDQEYTYKQIAEMYESSVSCVSKRVNKLIKEGYIEKRASVRRVVFDNLYLKKNTNSENKPRTTCEEITKLYIMGISVEDICTKLDCCESTVYKAMKHYRKVNNMKEYIKPPLDKEYILELYSNDLTYEQIFKISGINITSIFRTVDNAISKNIIKDRKLNSLKLREKKMIIMYRNGLSIKAIARILKIAKADVYRKINYFKNIGILLEEKEMNSILSNNKSMILKLYNYAINIQSIAWCLKISEDDVRNYINTQKISKQNLIIEKMVKKYRPLEISKKLDIPVEFIYLHLKEII